MPVTIKKVATSKELRTFAEFPNVLYKGNPYYVPTLVPDDVATFSKDRNAAFDFCDADFFLAYKDGKTVGRVAAILNPRAIAKWNKNAVRFGWIDFIDDREVSSALLKTVEEWGRERGTTEIEGPLGFTDFDTEGMLVDGYDQLGTMVTFYHHPYYKEHLEALGYVKATDWVEFRMAIPEELPEKYGRYSRLLLEKYNLRIRKYSRREIKKYDVGHKLFHLINHTYCDLYGYSELSERQIDQYVKLYLGLLDLNLVSFIVDENEDIVAFGVMIPSMSKALQKAGGKYFPFGWFHLARALVFKKTDTVDMLLIAVRRDMRKQGLPALVIYDLHPRLRRMGFKWCESNPELEDNVKVQNLWSIFDPVQHKRRRIYTKDI